VPVPEQPQKAKVSKLCKNTRKKVSASTSGDAPPLKQRRLGWKPVRGMGKLDTGQSLSGGQLSDFGTDTAAECAASQRPRSSQLNSSYTDRLIYLLYYLLLLLLLLVTIFHRICPIYLQP